MINYIVLIDKNIDEEDSTIYYINYYRKIKFQDKIITVFTKTQEIKNYEHLYYFWVNYRTTKTNNILKEIG